MKRWAIRIVSLVVILVLLSYLFGSIDYWRVRKGENPFFVLNWSGFFDGGTYVGLGFCYQVVANHGCKYSMEHKKPNEDFYWTEGPELKFWFFPFLNKSDLKFKSIGSHSPNGS